MNIEEMEVKIFKALAHPARLAIVKQLLNQSQCVCELIDIVGISQSNLSQHIGILKEANIITQKREGTRINCLINNNEIGKIVKGANKIVKNQLEEMLKQA